MSNLKLTTSIFTVIVLMFFIQELKANSYVLEKSMPFIQTTDELMTGPPFRMDATFSLDNPAVWRELLTVEIENRTEESIPVYFQVDFREVGVNKPKELQAASDLFMLEPGDFELNAIHVGELLTRLVVDCCGENMGQEITDFDTYPSLDAGNYRLRIKLISASPTLFVNQVIAETNFEYVAPPGGLVPATEIPNIDDFDVPEVIVSTSDTPEADESLEQELDPNRSYADCLPIVTASPTGRTSGRIATVSIRNNCDFPIQYSLGPFLIPSGGDRQGYVVPQTVTVEVPAWRTKSVELEGWCVDVDRTPAGYQSSFPAIEQWIDLSDDSGKSYSGYGSHDNAGFKNVKDKKGERKLRYPNQSGGTLPYEIDFTQYPAAAAPILVDAANLLEKEWEQSDESLSDQVLAGIDIPNKREIFIQQSLWQYASHLNGFDYEFKDFEKMVNGQEITGHWRKANDKAIEKQFDLELRRLWDRTQLFGERAGLWYLPAKGSHSVTSECLGGGIASGPYSTTSSIWDNVALTGLSAKIDRSKTVWPYVVGGAALIGGGAAAYILLQEDCIDKIGDYSLTFKGDRLICPNESGNLTVETNCTDCTVRWNDGATGFSRSVEEAGVYVAILTDGDGCEKFRETTVGLRELATASITGEKELCANSQISLTANPDCTGCTYSWSNGETGRTITVGNTASYSVTVTTLGGCSSSAVHEVSLQAQPVVNILGNGVICSDSPEILEAVVSNCIDCTYSWSNGQTGSAITVESAGNYNVSILSPQGCQGFAQYSLQAAEPVSAVVSGGSTICAGQSTVLTAAQSCIGCSYQWSNEQGVAIGQQSSLAVSNGGSFVLTVTNSQGCAESSITTIAQQNVDLFVGGELSFCAGGSTVLSALSSCSDCNYTWSNGAVGNELFVAEPGEYSVSVVSASTGCANSAVVTVVNDFALDLMINGSAEFCPTENTVLESSYVCDGCTYQWSDGTVGTTTTVSQESMVALTVTTPLGCTETAELMVTPAIQPTIEIAGPNSICAGSTVTLEAITDCVGCTFSWSTGLGTPTIDVSAGGLYGLTVLTAANCVLFTETEISVSEVEAIDDVFNGLSEGMLNFNVLLNDFGGDITLLEMTPLSSGGAIMSFDPSGDFLFSPTPGFSGVVLIEYVIQGCGDQEDTGVVAINLSSPLENEDDGIAWKPGLEWGSPSPFVPIANSSWTIDRPWSDDDIIATPVNLLIADQRELILTRSLSPSTTMSVGLGMGGGIMEVETQSALTATSNRMVLSVQQFSSTISLEQAIGKKQNWIMGAGMSYMQLNTPVSFSVNEGQALDAVLATIELARRVDLGKKLQMELKAGLVTPFGSSDLMVQTGINLRFQ